LSGSDPSYTQKARAGHRRQAGALEPAVKKAKTFVPLNPAVQPLIEALASDHGREFRWKLIINEPVELGS
jgi:hypothetical protein